MDYFTDYREIADRVLKLSGLKMNEAIPIRIDKDTHEDRLELLFLIGLANEDGAHRKLKLVLSPVVYLQSEITPVFDILGEYLPDKPEIVIYEALCEKTARAINIPKDIVSEMAYAHAVTHAITHLGKDPHQKTWEDYAVADTADKELFAHLYPFLLYSKQGDLSRKDAFSVITQSQNPKFNAWEDFIHKPEEEITRMLAEARQKSLPKYNIILSEWEKPTRSATSSDIVTTILDSDGRLNINTGTLDNRKTMTVSDEALYEIRKVIIETGIMEIEEMKPGDYEYKIDKLRIKYGKIEKNWTFYDNRMGSYRTIFERILTLFRKACKEAKRMDSTKNE